LFDLNGFGLTKIFDTDLFVLETLLLGVLVDLLDMLGFLMAFYLNFWGDRSLGITSKNYKIENRALVWGWQIKNGYRDLTLYPLIINFYL